MTPPLRRDCLGVIMKKVRLLSPKRTGPGQHRVKQYLANFQNASAEQELGLGLADVTWRIPPTEVVNAA